MSKQRKKHLYADFAGAVYKAERRTASTTQFKTPQRWRTRLNASCGRRLSRINYRSNYWFRYWQIISELDPRLEKLELDFLSGKKN